MTKGVARTIRTYVSLLKEEGIPVTEVRLFGSRAGGSARWWSDIDLCVVSPRFGRDYRAEGMRLRQLAARLHPRYPIEPIPYHPRDLRDRYDTLAVEIRNHGKTIRL